VQLFTDNQRIGDCPGMLHVRQRFWGQRHPELLKRLKALRGQLCSTQVAHQNGQIPNALPVTSPTNPKQDPDNASQNF
jgi:hypothetical protein